MPIYEYECKKCGRQTEAFQRFSDPPLTHCENCRGKLVKLISHSAFHLKGSGWYVTDYASKSRANQGKEPKSESASASGDSGTATEAAKPKDAPSKKSTDD